MMQKLQPRSKISFFVLVGMSTAILLAAPVIILLLVGFALDTFLHTKPTFMLIGVIIGFVSGIINVSRLMKVIQKRK
jgi:ATP synthase protein I